MVNQPRFARVLTFESWVSTDDSWKYAESHPDLVPRALRLTDRSPCMEPFFDHLNRNRGLGFISGLCRLRKNFELGQQFLYVTRVNEKVLKLLGKSANEPYFAVAMLEVVAVHASHQDAAEKCQQGFYVCEGKETAYPPNLIPTNSSDQCVPADRCICHDNRTNKTYTLDNIPNGLYEQQVRNYYNRQVGHKLRVAECSVKALSTDTQQAPLIQLPVKKHRGVLKVGDSKGDSVSTQWFDNVVERIRLASSQPIA